MSYEIDPDTMEKFNYIMGKLPKTRFSDTIASFIGRPPPIDEKKCKNINIDNVTELVDVSPIITFHSHEKLMDKFFSTGGYLYVVGKDGEGNQKIIHKGIPKSIRKLPIKNDITGNDVIFHYIVFADGTKHEPDVYEYKYYFDPCRDATISTSTSTGGNRTSKKSRKHRRTSTTKNKVQRKTRKTRAKK